MSLAMIANTVNSVINTIADPDLSGLDKFQAIITSLVSMIPMAIMGVHTIGTAIKAEGAGA